MRAIDFLKDLRDLGLTPLDKAQGKFSRPSNKCLQRWLENSSVLINGVKPNDVVTFPIDEMVFFPKNPRKVTYR